MKRCLSMLLVMSLLIGCIAFNPVTAVDADATKTEAVKAEAAVPEAATPEGQSTTVQRLQADLVKQLDAKGIFQHIDETAFRKAGHTYRLTEEEDLNTYVFQNQDGTKSIYYMQENVKYKAADGSIRDKDIRLVRQADGYSIRENMVDLWIPDSVEDGIRVDYGKQSIRLLPLGGSGDARQQDNSVVYADFYGPGMDLKYTPTLSGLKEDIILEAYTGVNSFSFLLETGGLYLCEAGGKYYLATSQTARATFYLGEIIVFDAIGRPSEGTMTVETVTPGEAYRLTISADIDFLTDPTTVYPVTIDPTVTVTDTTIESMIEDSPVFSNYPNNNHGYGAFLYNSIGYTNATLGTGRTVFRFNGLLADPKFNSVATNMISKVEFFVRDAGTNGNYQVNIHAILGNSTWTESTVTWNSVSNYSSTVYDSETLGYSYWSTFDITLLAKGWKNGTLNGQCGLIMVAANESQYIVTCSTDYTYDTLWPYVVMTYEDDFYLNHSVKELEKGESFTLVGIVNSATNTSLSWSSSNSSVASVSASGYVTGHVAGTATITATYTDAQGNTAERYCTVHVTMPNGVYRFDNLGSNMRMEARQGGIADGTLIAQQLNITQTLHELRYYAQMWKIEYVSNGNYTIRPMHRLGSMLYYLPSNQTAIKEFTSTPSSALWKIEQVGNSYVIRASDNSKVLAPAGSSTAVNAVIQTVTYNANSTAHKWTLTTVTGLADKLLLIDCNNLRTVTSPNVYIAPKETRSLQDMGLAVSFVSAGTNNPVLHLSAMSGTISANNSNGTVTGNTANQTEVLQISCLRNGVTYAQSVIMHVTAIPEGVYYIRNWGMDGLVQCQTIANGAPVYHMGFTGEETQQWVLTHLGDGSYTIHKNTSAASATKYYLGVSGDSSAEGQSIVLRTGTVTSGMRWNISVTGSGAYKLAAQCSVGADRVLKANPEPRDDNDVLGRALIQSLYVLDDDYAGETNEASSTDPCFYYAYGDEWLLCPPSSTYSFEAQQKSYWCWLACARIAASRFMESPISQRSAAMKLAYDTNEYPRPTMYRILNPTDSQLSDRDHPGTGTDLAKAIRYIMGTPAVDCLSGCIDEDELRAALDEAPVIVSRTPHRNGQPYKMTHVTIIYGYSEGETPGTYVYHIFDPMPAGHVDWSATDNKGQHLEASYEWICDGNSGSSAEDPESDDGIWCETVVFLAGDS